MKEIREQVGDKKVLCALSGGVDSSVIAALIHKAVGDQLTCMFMDHGLLRKGEAESVMRTFAGKFRMNVVKIDARERFLDKLAGVTDPEQKRKIIGNEFIYVFEEESAKLGEFQFLGARHPVYRHHRSGNGDGPDDQVPPQCGRPAGKHEVQSWSSRSRRCSRMKCAKSAKSWVFPRRSSGASPSPVPVWGSA